MNFDCILTVISSYNYTGIHFFNIFSDMVKGTVHTQIYIKSYLPENSIFGVTCFFSYRS